LSLSVITSTKNYICYYRLIVVINTGLWFLWCAINKQGLTEPIFVEGTKTN